MKNNHRTSFALSLLLLCFGVTPKVEASGIYRPPRVKTAGQQSGEKKEECKPGPEGDDCRKKKSEKKENAG